MAARIRLKRMGAKKRPFYRVVVADARAPRDGRFIETLGTYNPLARPAEVNLNAEKVHLWLTRGAQPSDPVKRLLTREGFLAVDGSITSLEALVASGAEETVSEEPAAETPAAT